MMNCPGPVLLASVIWMVLIATCSFTVADKGGGYPDSIQSLGYGAPYGVPSAGSGGSGYGNEPANYDFEYEVFGGGNYFGHQESRRDKNTNGKYHVLLPDGRRQIVTYIADETGYHPTITYEDASSTGGEGGYPASSAPDSGYGAPVADNSLNNRYSSRIKRQHLTDQEDVVQFYNPENKPDQRFRNTQRHRRFTPQKGYLIVYPTSPKVSEESKKLNAS